MTIEYKGFIGGQMLENQSKIGTFKVRNFRRGAEINVNPDLIFEIGLNETPVACCEADTFAKRLDTMYSVTLVTVNWFAKYFGVA
jgi:hypothetical protein